MRILWMQVFQLMKTHPRVFLVNQLQSREEKRYRANTAFFLTSPQDQNCDVCLRTKLTCAPCRKRTREALPREEKFGDLIMADHKVLNEGCESRDNHHYAIVVQNLHKRRKTVHESSSINRKRHTFSDNSLEIGKTCEAVEALLQSGLDERWWSDSVECCCHLRNVQDLLADAKTPHEKLFGEPFRGPLTPFGATEPLGPRLFGTHSRRARAWRKSAGRVWDKPSQLDTQQQSPG